MSFTSRIAGAVAACGLAAVAATGPAAVAEAGVHAATVETVPVTVDSSNQSGWWNPLAVVGDTTYFAYNVPAAAADRHEVHLAARAADGTWTTGCLRLTDGACADFLDDNGHNQPSIAVDGAGTIHAFVSMHHEEWHYFRSTTAGDVRSLVDASAELPAAAGGTVSYPITAVAPDGDVWLMVRTGPDALARRDGVLYRYDLGTGVWSHETVIASATNFSVYPDDLAVSEDGRVHVLWEWHRWAAGPYRHLGSYAIWDPTTRTVTDVAGTALSAPVGPNEGGHVVWQPFTGSESMTSTAPAVQTAKMALQDGRLAGIVHRFVGEGETRFDLRWATWDGTAWGAETLIDASALGADVDTVAAMDATAAGSKLRAYGVVTVPCGSSSATQVVMFESAAGRDGWTVEPIGNAMPGQQRLRAATTDAGTDVLYLSAPATPGGGTLRYAEIPRSGQKRSGSQLADVVSALRTGSACIP